MNNLLVRYKILTNRDGTVLIGNFINVYWDDSALAFVVHHFDNEADTTGTVLTSGPDLGADRFDYSRQTTTSPIPYSYCSGADLQTFKVQSLFPYANKTSTANHFSCLALVCDLTISDDFTIHPCTDFTTSDGAVEVSATSSNGSIKFSLDPAFDFATQGQASGLFAGLYTGEYTITAKDALGCVDQITVTIPVPDFYNPLYRLEYDDHNGLVTRVDILERGFAGAVTEVNGGADPFILRYNGDGEIDKFSPIIPSEARLTLMSESNFFFRDLFTQDERKYQVKYYKDYGSTSGAFTPAVMDALNLWTNVASAFVETPPYLMSWDWNVGATPTVNFGDSGSGFTHGLNTQSDLYRTLYSFVAARSYSFDYNFVGITSPAGFSPIDAVYKIQIIDASNNVLTEKIVNYVVASGASTGTYTFLAPGGAAGIAIIVLVSSSGSQHSFSIASFTNQTASVSAGATGFELEWFGYLIPNNYSEAYLAPPYPIQITATDGLADLKTYDFVDVDDNEFREDITTLKAICEVLKKTDLGINILSSINRFETAMVSTASDDPLTQCKFDPETFYHDNNNCFEVLSEILKPFGARILQRKGKWFIYSVEEAVTVMSYREFTSDNLYVSNGTITDTVNIAGPVTALRAAFRNQSQTLSIVGAYGKLFFEHTLLKNASLIRSYSFEEEDVYENTDGLKLFSDWNINISDSPGATYGIKETKALEGNFNFFVKYLVSISNNFAGQGEVIVTSSPIQIEYENVDVFEYRFSYASLIAGGDFSACPWVKVKWMLQIGLYYFVESTGLWTTDINQKYNDIYNDRFNDTQEKKITASLRDVTGLTLETGFVEFILTSNATTDFTTTALLKATATTTKSVGAKMKVAADGATIVSFYTLEAGTSAESSPDILRPNDYAASTNEKIWVLETSTSVRGKQVAYNYLDSVVLLHFPTGAQPPENITIERNNNAGIKVNFEETYLLNDVDLDNINNSERTYKNFFKLLTGTPTQVWARTYRAGTGKLLDLVSNDYISQYKNPTNKLTGSFIADTPVRPTSVLTETGDSNKKYMFMGYELDDKAASIAFDILEVKDTVTDDESEAIDAEFNTDFNLDFTS